MSASYVILHRELVALEILHDLRLDDKIGILRHAAAISCGGRIRQVVLHVGVIFQRICIPIGCLAQMGIVLMGYGCGLDARVVGLRDSDADDDKEEKNSAYSNDAG